MKSLKPLGSRIISVEEARRIVESMPDLYPPEKPIRYSGELVDFHGFPLVKEEYSILESLASRFGKTSVEYFWNVADNEGDVYLEIKNQHVKLVSMEKQNLRIIPYEIGKLYELEVLFLGDQRIVTISNIDTLTKLEHLSLYGNEIQRIGNLDTLTNLTQIDLRNNQLTKLENLDSLTELKRIFFSGNSIDYPSPHNMREMNKLAQRGCRFR